MGFADKMSGEGNDPDDLIVQAFKAYDNEGKIDSKMFQHALTTWGDKMTKAEIDDIFNEFEIDRTTWSRPRRLLVSSLPSRRKRRRRRRRKKHPLKQLQRRRMVMPRRRRRGRRRPPSK